MVTLPIRLMADDQFRKEILDLCKGVMREVATAAIAQTLHQDNWITTRVDQWLTANGPRLIASLPFNNKFAQDAIALIRKENAQALVELKGKIRDMVKEEMRRGVMVKLGPMGDME